MAGDAGKEFPNIDRIKIVLEKHFAIFLFAQFFGNNNLKEGFVVNAQEFK